MRTIALYVAPCDAVDTANAGISELVESGRGEVKIPLGAADAAVSDLDGDGLALV